MNRNNQSLLLTINSHLDKLIEGRSVSSMELRTAYWNLVKDIAKEENDYGSFHQMDKYDSLYKFLYYVDFPRVEIKVYLRLALNEI